MNLEQLRNPQFWKLWLRKLSILAAGFVVLVGLLILTAELVFKFNQRRETQQIANGLGTAVSNYYHVFRQFPGNSPITPPKDYQVMTSRNSGLLSQLMGINPQNIIFFSTMKEGYPRFNMGGLVYLGDDLEDASLVDPWGAQYLVVVDADQDGKVMVTYENGTPFKVSVTERAFASSPGPDGEFGTQDDISNEPVAK